MNIIRKIKLNQLGYYEFKDSEKELSEFIKENLLDLKEIKLEHKLNSVIMYFNNKDENIFQYHLNSNNFYFRLDYIGEVFEKKFNYNFQQTTTLIKNIMEQTYKLKGFQIKMSDWFKGDKWNKLPNYNN